MIHGIYVCVCDVCQCVIFHVAGTPLTAMHFRVGDYVDVQGRT